MKPEWLKVKIGCGANFKQVKDILTNKNIHAICEEARCPNRTECYGDKTATFLILGDICTRDCGYCSVKHGQPDEVDKEEASRIAEAVKELGLKYVVITSVTRDDLDDYGASLFADTIRNIKDCKVEVLIPDFKGNLESLKKVIEAKPSVIGHNIEITKRLFKKARKQGSYDLSLDVLRSIKKIDSKMKTKSSFMVGLGETSKEIDDTLNDLKKTKVDIITIGQYLKPTKDNLKVERYYKPEEFEGLKKKAEKMGFKVEAGPFVRSSYKAKGLFESAR